MVQIGKQVIVMEITGMLLGSTRTRVKQGLILITILITLRLVLVKLMLRLKFMLNQNFL